ncbi:ankyrin repeat-containing domain protein [Mycena maculata]|uniref:Ankyrin repeat-containing domain protein n=1 Tax=Mycena maculata TaxID=230809 RepID=A0AAD7MP40_9AGAR|nr:ankyrin repeat-containing domain protein [Mycena maculata]
MESRDITATPSPLRRVKGWLAKKSTKKAVQPDPLHSSGPDVNTGVDALILAANMIEKLANVVNRVPLIAPVAALVSEVLTTVKEVQDMHGSRDTLHTELQDKIRDFSGATSQESSYVHRTEHLKHDLEVYRRLLEDASKLVSDFDAHGSLRTTVQYPLWRRRFDDIEKRVESFESRFILNRVTNIEIAQAEQAIHDKLYKWLQSPPDMTSKQDEMQMLRHENTGSWFLNGPEFSEWKANPGSLWIRGNSGTGKSVLCSTVIRDVCMAADGKSSAVAYFYFDFTDDKCQRPDIMLQSIVFQLSALSSPPYKALGQLHNTLSGVPPRHEDLLKVLDEVLSELGRCYVILDALDECNEADFHRLVDFIKTPLGRPNERPLHLLFTSQPRQIFMEEFHDLTLVELESGATENDIRSFVESGVSHLKSWATQAEQVTEQVVQKSSGMFRLATCLLKELDDCWWEETLNALPSDLYGIYDRFLKRVPSKRLIYVQAIFRWLLFAAHPVTLNELADAIAFNFSDPVQFIYDPRRRKDNTSAIFKWLDGLILIKDHDYSWHPEPEPEKSVALAHASVQDYILSKQFTDKFAAGQDFTAHPSHKFLAQSCVHYLLYFSDTEHPLNSETFPNYPLSMYAAKYWFHHLQHCDNQDALFDLAMHLLQDGSSQYTALNHLHDVIGYGDGPDWTRSIPSPLVACSKIGYTAGVCFLLENGANINAVGGQWGTTLQTAAWEGFTQIVGLLLNKGANLYPKTGSSSGSPLDLACCKGHTEVVRMLLDHGAIPSAPDGELCKALGSASDRAHIDIVDLLLKNGVNPNTTSKRFGSALHAAVGPIPRGLDHRPTIFIANRRQITDLLLKNGANINAVGGKYGGVLQAASAGGILEIVQLFVNKGLDVNHIEGGKYSPLQAALEAGHSDIVHFLLENGAEVNTQGGNFGSALQAAAAAMLDFLCLPDMPAFIESQTKLISLLLASGANPNSTGGKFGSALCAASSGGHHEIITILLDHGTNVNIECGVFGGALQAAAGPLRPKWMQTVTEDKFLVMYRTKLLVRRKKSIQVLLDKGAIVNVKFGTALQIASRWGHADIVQVLLKNGADVDTGGDEHGTALQIASRWGHPDIVRILLENGVNIDAGDADHGTALQIASRWGHADIVRILLEKGANVDSNFGKRGTAFHMTSRWGHKEIVEILREHGAQSGLDVAEVPNLTGFWK